jgi:3-hydroxybutyryl-CoA dehydrogenase|tara:strand:+ start:2456 stop:3379 length:924 start_codon:yes stop_codon:yes gene_type:complete
MNQDNKHIAVIGSGLMGHGIAQIFLAAGHTVALYDTNKDILAEAKDKICEIFSLLEQDVGLAGNLTRCDTLAQSVQDADFVFEAGPEKLEIKQAIFREVCESTKPTAILASNTSAIPIGAIGSAVRDPSRVVGTHFWNPPHLVRLVEVVQSEATALEVVEQTIALLEHAAMKAIHVKRDIPGFIGNRLQHAMKREAIALVAAGVCDAETIDTVVKHSFGARLAVLGPLEQSDLVGLDLTLDILNVLFPALDNTNVPPPYLVEKVNRGELGMKTGKGFREWTPESAERVRNEMRDFLVERAKKSLGST